MLPFEFGSGSTYHRRFRQWVQPGIFKKIWMRLLEEYDGKIGIKLIWQSLDRMINKVDLRDDDCRKQFSVDRSEIGTKRHILNDKQGMPVSMTISLSSSSATTYDIKLVKGIIDNSVI